MQGRRKNLKPSITLKTLTVLQISCNHQQSDHFLYEAYKVEFIRWWDKSQVINMTSDDLSDLLRKYFTLLEK